MDSLPEEVVFLIASYLPRPYVFKRLGSKYCEIINKNRKYLNYSADITVIFAENSMEIKSDFHVHTHFRRKPTYKHEELKVMRGVLPNLYRLQHSTYDVCRNSYFEPLFIREHSLLEIFEFIFQKSDIHTVKILPHSNAEHLKSFKEAMEYTFGRVLNAYVNSEALTNDQFEVLRAMANPKRHRNNRPSLRFSRSTFIPVDNIRDVDRKLKAYGFRNATLEIDSYGVNDCINKIAEAWEQSWSDIFIELYVQLGIGHERYICGDVVNFTIEDDGRSLLAHQWRCSSDYQRRYFLLKSNVVTPL